MTARRIPKARRAALGARLATIAVTALLFGGTRAHAIVGDSFGAFGLDGSLRLIALGTQNYDAPFLFGSDNEADGLSQTILRLAGAGRPRDWLHYEVHGVQSFTVEAFGGPGAGRGDVTLLGARSGGRYRLVPLQVSFGEREREDVHADLFFDRLNVKLSTDAVDVTIGRQAVTFGTTYFWNPLDVFAAFAATQFDRDYKDGVDALRLDIPLGDFSGMTLVGALGPHDAADPWFEAALVARAYTTVAHWDMALQGGKLRGGYQAAVAVSGQALDFGLRGEAAHFWPLEGEPLAPHVAIVLGLGRRFPNSLHLEAEYFYNGGATGELATRFNWVEEARLLQASRQLAGLSLSYELLPILAGSLSTIVSLSDGSGLVQPGLTYSAADEVSIVAGAVVPWGERPTTDPLGLPQLESELGTYPSYYYVEMKAYF